MENCVRTARAAGVFKQFHVLCDRPLEGCECYDAFQCDKAHGLFKLHYLKVGMSRLAFDFFVWIDADTVFVRNPVHMLGALGRSPIHVPLELNLSVMKADCMWKGLSCLRLREAFQAGGVTNQVYLSRSAFWIVHREAIAQVYELALQFWNDSKEGGLLVNADVALGYAAQMLSASPEAHLLTKQPDLWASDDLDYSGENPLAGRPWKWRHPLGTELSEIRPAVLHLPARRSRPPPLFLS